jgi:mono/diheme cytochrome c family protein
MNIGGTSNMPAFGEILSDEEITAVLAYIKSNWTEENQAWQQEATLRESEISQP